MSEFSAIRPPGAPRPASQPAATSITPETVPAAATVIYVREVPEPRYGYAPWLSRVAAYLIDMVVVFVIAIVLAGIAAGLLGPGAIGAAFLLSILYFPLMHARESGQTLGKKALRIAVRDLKGGRATVVQTFGRLCVVVLFGLIPFLLLFDSLSPFWVERKRAYHDKIAGTAVIKTTR
jgi:uncharacterized RDD family membrane protein YckC